MIKDLWDAVSLQLKSWMEMEREKKKIIEDLKKTTWTHICRSMFQLLKTSNEEKILRATRGRKTMYVQSDENNVQ